MTERTIKSMAIELAGEFYEGKRSGRFRSMDELTTARRVMRRPQDGALIEVKIRIPFRRAYPTAHSYAVAHWPLFYESARQCLVTMLALPDAKVPPHLKEAIFAAIKEDREKQNRYGGRELFQVRELQG
jgi:hypothetical protein